MKIALFNEKYHPNVSGGAEKSVKVLADALRVRGVTPEVITLSPGTGTRVDSVDGVRVHYLASRNFFWPFDGKRRARWRMWTYHARHAADAYRPERLADDYIAVYERLIGSRRDRAAVVGTA